MAPKMKKEYYQALISKNTAYDGVFYVGVKTTGVFCRPSCAARKPKLEHCEFFETPQQALLASYRPCKRCQPLSHPQQTSPLIQKLVAAVEANPEKRWQDKDFRKLGVDESTARRQFKKRFGMTFVAYARARRMGIAMKQIREGNKIIDVQLNSGYESSSGFRDAFSKIMGEAPNKIQTANILKAAWLDTPLGPMITIADEKSLYLLEFVDRRGLEREIERLRKKTKSGIVPGQTGAIDSIKKELEQYFAGKLFSFKTSLVLLGSPFQQKVWQQLLKIPTGKTLTYADIAVRIKKPSAWRAVANANGANQFAIVVPCHRVINSNGELGGYGGGLARKKWLLDHEKKSNR